MNSIEFTFQGFSYRVADWDLYCGDEAIQIISEIDPESNKNNYLIILDFHALSSGRVILIKIKKLIKTQILSCTDSLCQKVIITEEEKDLLRKRILRAQEVVGTQLANVNICGMFWIDEDIDYKKLYQKFITSHNMPYNFHINLEGLEFCGASPETLLKIKKGECRVVPLSGSVPTSEDLQQREREAVALLKDNKEIHEHNAIVQEVCSSFESICTEVNLSEEKKIYQTEYSQHISSTVAGKLQPEVNLMDILKKVFPPVAISGVPKIKAMDVIDQIEGKTRNYYGGAVGFINGNEIDFGVIIRSFIRRENKSLLQVGSKISVGSNINSELEEILYKAGKVLEILE